MKYEKIVAAKFIERENRFVARVEMPDGEICRVHVKNTGRCRELLLPGSRVYLEDFEGRMGSRRMRYSLVAVEKAAGGTAGQDAILINMDSQAPNKVVQEALEDGTIRLPGLVDEQSHGGSNLRIRPETTYGSSRFDFYVERDDGAVGGNGSAAGKRGFVEVKGVTLEEFGHAMFPDAPTERGVKHINELIEAHREGYEAYIIFVVQMEGVRDVSPNDRTHPQFGEALARAQEEGVIILAYDCLVTPDSLRINKRIGLQIKP